MKKIHVKRYPYNDFLFDNLNSAIQYSYSIISPRVTSEESSGTAYRLRQRWLQRVIQR